MTLSYLPGVEDDNLYFLVKVLRGDGVRVTIMSKLPFSLADLIRFELKAVIVSRLVP